MQSKAPAFKHYLESWVASLKHVQRRTGLELVLPPHTRRPGEGDGRYWHDLPAAQIPDDIRLMKIDAPSTTCDIQPVVAGSHFVISSRMQKRFDNLWNQQQGFADNMGSFREEAESLARQFITHLLDLLKSL